MGCRWKVINVNVPEKWAKLSDDDLELIARKKDRLLGKLQAYYRPKKGVAEKEIDSLISGINTSFDKFF